ncbi:hypothetical protein ONS95_010580 [Cadophora gregata]|uniref:uncharacterized protein n=1 Tax=Cadophora gregata TaxID=51156 RepID=UPI0026DB24B6|nr:uncharacterized protein ONS95_010580 [Cadophora gregata]KAK0122339.1 hypothetical protein ONS95_010580 [Cadophora gregata]
MIAQAWAKIPLLVRSFRFVAKGLRTIYKTAYHHLKIKSRQNGDYIEMDDMSVVQVFRVLDTLQRIDIGTIAGRALALATTRPFISAIGGALTGANIESISEKIGKIIRDLSDDPVEPPSETPTISISKTISASTTTQSSTSSSSSTTAAATPVPILIITRTGTTENQFNALLKDLPSDPRNYDISQSSVNLFMTVAFLNLTFAHELRTNAIVQSLSLEVFSNFPLLDVGSTEAPRAWPEEDPNLKRDLKDDAAIHTRATGCPEATPGASNMIELFLQRVAPNHLQWLSRIQRSPQTAAAAYRFNSSYLFSQQHPVSTDRRPEIFVLDSGINKDHQVNTSKTLAESSFFQFIPTVVFLRCFSFLLLFLNYYCSTLIPLPNQEFATILNSPSFIPGWLWRSYTNAGGNAGGSLIPQTAFTEINDLAGHGTCMASVAAGRFSGTIKNVRFNAIKVATGTVPVDDISGPTTRAAPISSITIAEAFGWVIAQVREKNLEGRAIISFSMGMYCY